MNYIFLLQVSLVVSHFAMENEFYEIILKRARTYPRVFFLLTESSNFFIKLKLSIIEIIFRLKTISSLRRSELLIRPSLLKIKRASIGNGETLASLHPS